MRPRTSTRAGKATVQATAAALLLTTLTAARADPAVATPGSAGGPHAPAPPHRAAVAVGYGGAVSSVNPYATQAGIDVL